MGRQFPSLFTGYGRMLLFVNTLARTTLRMLTCGQEIINTVLKDVSETGKHSTVRDYIDNLCDTRCVFHLY